MWSRKYWAEEAWFEQRNGCQLETMICWESNLILMMIIIILWVCYEYPQYIYEVIKIDPENKISMNITGEIVSSGGQNGWLRKISPRHEKMKIIMCEWISIPFSGGWRARVSNYKNSQMYEVVEFQVKYRSFSHSFYAAAEVSWESAKYDDAATLISILRTSPWL